MSKKRNKNKKYIMATKFYQNGEIDKALKKCEESIAEDLKNSAALNLKGLLLYLKGDLKGAVATWKINADFNDDDIAKNYIEDSKRDKDKIKLYKEAEVLLTRLSINEAEKKLNMCKESDFNAIKVNLALSVCYLRKGDYENAGVSLTKALSIDKNNPQGKKIAKEFEKYSDSKLEILKSTSENTMKVLMGLVCAVAIFVVLFGGYKIINKFINSNDTDVLSTNNNENENLISNKENIESEQEEVTNSKNNEDENGDNNIKVDVEKIQSCIDSKNYDELYNLVNKLNINELSGKEQAVTKIAQELLIKEGCEYFYNSAMKYYNTKDYDNALIQIEKAYKYSQTTYLASEVLFFDGAINDKKGNNNQAIKLYEEYYNKYKNGDYIGEVLYGLAMLYKSEDLSKAKMYANELNNNHSESMYNNENIKSLLN
ncbi:MAG: tetratricopeptide repeat protein [Clostridiales bacterium]|nr:tetratricopeptide repeat protein [Clostridiales bacterium]MDY2730397.1 tetratricopeptide repeat protein [Clostridium sp.]